MATPFTDNNGTTFYNINQCRSFNQPLSTTLVALTANQPCSEVIIINKTGNPIYIYDSDYSSAANRLLLSENETITLRGITNSLQVSSQTISGEGMLYYRTQFFSFLPQR